VSRTRVSGTLYVPSLQR